MKTTTPTRNWQCSFSQTLSQYRDTPKDAFESVCQSFSFKAIEERFNDEAIYMELDLPERATETIELVIYIGDLDLAQAEDHVFFIARPSK